MSRSLPEASWPRPGRLRRSKTGEFSNGTFGEFTSGTHSYCIGGTLLAMTLAYLAARRDRRFGAATFMVSLLDFSEVGDAAVFIDEPHIVYMEQQMLERVARPLLFAE